MIFTETPLRGAFVIDPEKKRDDRGFFARSYCAQEFRQHGLELPVAQCNVSFNLHRGTLRGMHYQVEPKAERKLVRCTRGAIFDVLVDVRRDSSTCCRWYGTELTVDNHRALYIPEGFAHGFITLEPDCEVFYQMSESFSPEQARGVRWNDGRFGIEWPITPACLSDRDASYADFVP